MVKQSLGKIWELVRANFSPFAAKVFVGWLAVLFVGFLVACNIYGFPFWPMTYSDLTSWDSKWYFDIAMRGYPGDLSGPDAMNFNFFPVFPLILQFLTFITGSPIRSVALILSLVCFFLALQLIHYLLTKIWKIKPTIAKFTIAALAFSPSAFVFAMAYTESFFLLLVVLTFIFIGKKRFIPAAVVAGIASGTRTVGVVLGLAVITAYICDIVKSHRFQVGPGMTKHAAVIASAAKQSRRKRLAGLLRRFAPRNDARGVVKLIVITVLSVGGLVAYLIFQWMHVGTPFAFIEVQSQWFHRLAGLSEGLFADFNHIFSGDLVGWTLAMSAVFAVFATIGGIWLIRRRQLDQKLHGGALLLASVIPLSTGTITAMSRYTMVFFGLFLWLMTALKYKWLRILWLIISIILLIISVIILCHPSRPMPG